MKMIVKLLLTGLIISVASYIVPGVGVENFRWAILIGIAISLLNTTVGNILRIISLPLNFLTLGLIGFLITLGVISLAGYIIPGFTIGGFWSLVFFALLVGVLETLFGMDAVN